MRFVATGVALRSDGGASSPAVTLICRVAVSEPPRPSLVLIVNQLVPESPTPGVPNSDPSAATESQAGPAVFANVKGSPSLSLASLATVAVNANPCVASGFTIGSLVNAGGLLVALAPPERKLATIAAVRSPVWALSR